MATLAARQLSRQAFEATPWLAIPESRRWLAGIVLAVSNFMVVLDMTIANVSVPHIAGDLGGTNDQGTWVITSYAVAEAICVPLTGWLAQRFGTVRVFIAAMLGFGIFSLLCGLSQTFAMIVIARVGQGFCGGPIMPMSQTLMVRVFPPEQRPKAMALWAMTTILGPASGPILGGFINDNWSWHWVFLINVPIAVVLTFAAVGLLAPVETAIRRVPIDRTGFALLVLWIGALQLMLDLGRDRDWFADPLIVALGLIAVIGFCVFLIWELTVEHPVVDLGVFRHRAFSTGVATQAICYGAFFATVVMVPQWLQTTMGYTATKAGVVSASHALAAVMVARFVAQIMPKVDPRILISIGVGWMGVMTMVRTGWTSSTDMFSLFWPTFVQGFAMPMMFIPLTTTVLSAVRPDETASAAGLQNFVRTMASAIAASLVLTEWGNNQAAQRVMLAGRLHGDAVQATLGQMGMNGAQATGYISYLVDREANTIALTHTFFISAMALFFASALIWTTPRIPLTRLTGDGPPAH